MARNMPLERYGLETIEIEIRSEGGAWESLSKQEAINIHVLVIDEDHHHYVFLEDYRADCEPVDHRIRMINTMGEVSEWSDTLTVSCPGQ